MNRITLVTCFRYNYIFFTLLFKNGINKPTPVKPQIIIMFIFATIYGFASTLQLNCALENSPAKIYKAAVLNHRISMEKVHHTS